jgi:peptidoglycan/xylan/chitin deacetylase (PgdA/CDA1 family)
MSGTVPILCYHSISQDRSGPLGPYTLPARLFEDHMAWVVEQGFSTMTVAGLQQSLDAGALLPARPLLITFDDGLADFLDDALGILDRRGLTATIFITTAGTWSARPRALAGRRTLSRAEVLCLRDAGIEIASHGHEHHQLDLRRRSDVAADLRTSKELLEDLLQLPVVSFAYPHGYNRRATRDVVRMSGFTSACAVQNRVSSVDDDRWRRPRLMLSGLPTAADLAALIHRVTIPHSALVALRGAAWRGVRLARTGGSPLVTVAESV